MYIFSQVFCHNDRKNCLKTSFLCKNPPDSLFSCCVLLYKPIYKTGHSALQLSRVMCKAVAECKSRGWGETIIGQRTTVYGQPTPNRAQSTDAGVSVKISLLNLCRATRKKTRLSLLELPRCKGGKDHEVGLTDNGQWTTEGGKIPSEGSYTQFSVVFKFPFSKIIPNFVTPSGNALHL